QDAVSAQSEGEAAASEGDPFASGEVAGASQDETANEVLEDEGLSDTESSDPSEPSSEDVPSESDPIDESEGSSSETDATSSEAIASSTEAEIEAGSGGGTEFATTTEESTSAASSTGAVIEEGSASSTDTTSSAVASDASLSPSADFSQNSDVASAEDSAIVAAREAAERDALKARLLEEVKAEFLSGCVTLERGGYYCLSDDAREGARAPVASGALSVNASTDGKGTDKEIFLSGSDAAIQLTDNAIEDAFPSKDLSGRSVVWQAEDSGRWQIMYADLSSSTPIVSAVTAGLESNFNPAVEGGTVVWQGWADGNWEIFMAERDILPDMIDQGDAARQVGATPGWRISRITTNSTHDMFPGVAGGMITWQAFDGSAWNVYAYSRATGETVRISAGEGSAERPRFAMLWEERGDDGRVRLMGYDMAKGERVDVTEEARAAGDGKRGPGMPPSPVSSPDQPALPIGSASSTAPVRPEGDAPPDPLAP
ncbi:MAG TPA: hypothetical protein VLB83_05650, partial [Candidatus Paceibacterota bacterium]|nr:hypothetical protein [Candidatus Paceibacterota bacterium]